MADRLILLKRSHENDEEMWRAIEESRAFIREYLFWVDGTQSLSDVEKATDMFFKAWDEAGEWCLSLIHISCN